MSMPKHLHAAATALREAGYAVIREERIRSVSSASRISLYKLRSLDNPAEFEEAMAAARRERMVEHLALTDGFVETTRRDPDSRFVEFVTRLHVVVD